MVNRVMQQKILKQKRMRRAWAKRFSMRNTGPMQNTGMINDQGKFVEYSTSSRRKAAKVRDLDKELNEALLKKFRFKPSDPESIYARHRGLHTDLTRDGEIVLARLTQNRTGVGALQGEQRYVYQIMKETETLTRRMYMGGDDCFFLETRLNSEGLHILWSIHYGDRKRALQAHLSDSITWDEIVYPPKADK